MALPSEKLKDYWKNRKKENFMADSDQFGWQTATSLVDGRILMDESTFPAMKFLRFRVDSTGTGGAAHKGKHKRPSRRSWANGERLDFRKGLAEYQTKKGVSTFVLALNNAKESTIRVELVNVEGSTAQTFFANLP